MRHNPVYQKNSPHSTKDCVVYLIDIISCATSGTEKQLLEIIKRLDRKKFQPHLVCLHESQWMRENTLPCPVHVLGYRGLLKPNIVQVISRLRHIIRDSNVAVLQTFFEDSVFVVWLATRLCRHRPVLLSSRRDMGLGAGSQPWYHHLFGLALPLVNRGFDGIVANSDQVRQYVAQREKVAEENIEVIYNGVESPEKCRETPPVLRRDSAQCWIVIVASLNPVKRHDILIEAVVRLKKKTATEQVRVLVLGTGPLEAQLKNRVTEKGLAECFVFQGAVQNVTDYLQHCDIGVLCSDREGLSNAILEYMSCGLPVVATAVGGNTELIDEKNGIVIPPGNAAALADALFELVITKEKRNELGRAAKKRAEQRFSWHQSMQHLESWYQQKIQEKVIRHA